MKLYQKIFIGMLLGVIWGMSAVYFNWGDFTMDWIAPWGTIFMNLLKLIAVPLIFVSLIKGISSLTDISKLSSMGLKTISLYIVSTVIAISIGLLLVNMIKPGDSFPEKTKTELLEKHKDDIQEKQIFALDKKSQGPLQFLVDIVPSNIFASAIDNSKMLQIIFFAFIFGIALILLPVSKQTDTVKLFFDGVNDVVLKIIELIMLFAPFGVFALFSAIIVDVSGDDIDNTFNLFIALGKYALTVIVGLLCMILIIYPLGISLFTKTKLKDFYSGIFSAQMLAFSTSSSAATLPVTMRCCEKNLGLNPEVTKFVLPVGATINMDGTSLYQAVAAVFIAQAFAYDLSLAQQLTIILTATLASIGSAAVPSAGIVMLVIVLESIGVPSAGIGLIFAIDRPLDMLRTAVNVTGDSTVASIVDRMEGH